jgi:auxin efflux carrier family protein
MELTFHEVTLFPLGGFLIIAKDFDGPDVESEDLRERMRIRRKLLAEVVFSLRYLPRVWRCSKKPCDVEARNKYQEKETVSRLETPGSKASTEWETMPATSPTSIIVPEDATYLTHVPLAERIQPSANHHSWRDLSSRAKRFLVELLKPMPIVIVIAIVIALVNPLKALFLPPSTNFQPRFRPVAPDGQPPLAFVLDTATFVGAASVPIGLICPGSALAHLRVLGSGKVFPRGAIAALALAKMVVTPILGVGITRLFVHAGFVHRDDKVLQFVCMCVRLRLGPIFVLL